MRADLPVPPPFMWTCQRCAELLDDLADALGIAASEDLFDGALRSQMILAGHIAHEHRAEVPPAHEDCPRCAYYARQPDNRGIGDLWLEHRARDLFLPASQARLM
ncbi:hypothetical protein OG252_33230 [Streptomyces sp. NBC_01352]|uniref:hypothetical protein n=1 Tax=Streptomyces sp. NBC_01352 TaxID=2903834 RepID=UPI002E2EE858|nr:hypothetical protein [Streptomyces sp. NBC_01352]